MKILMIQNLHIVKFSVFSTVFIRVAVSGPFCLVEGMMNVPMTLA
jgi:hypothetical protein